ncbi:hypothetical protein [Mycolicibacterium smegmatis]|uniref:Tripartite tricarboxylate transporter TctB family protein n=1 Tax=Mycolicibacterium smegmatis (strain MKD8) TaxID=1214915 RepID=A0A2U9PHK3_MYCSE|nr:hypothetical protein [Mycolicibacterium smegmatis]AWT51199.1 hypothetical protein D806_002050 [Mycolicibacterium smegmatis MKD8]
MIRPIAARLTALLGLCALTAVGCANPTGLGGGAHHTEDPLPQIAGWRGELETAARGAAWLAALVAGFYMVGALLSAAIFVPVFLRKVARTGYLTAVAYTTVVIVVLVLLRTFAGMYLPIGYLTPPGF